MMVLIVVHTDLEARHFNTLHEMERYAKQMPEYPEADDNNWLQPGFINFYRQLKISWLDSLLIKFGFKQPALWQVDDFASLLTDVLVAQEQSSYSGRFVMHITPKPGDRFVLWGDLEGAYHSLIRDLGELKRRGIINDALEIIQPHFYFVFNGNVVNRSPYILETLTVVLQLMKKNPQRVFYIRGYGEDKERWYDLGTKDELREKGRHITQEDVPLDDEIKRFFNTLPLALYIIAEQQKDEVTVVRISNYAGSTDEINELFMGNFFELPDQKHPALYKLFDRKQTTKKVHMAAVIKSEDRSWRYTQTQGLVRLGFEDGAIAWSLLSAPTGTYRHLYEFFWDSFVFLRIADRLSDWTLSLYNQDVREHLGFNKSAEYQLTSGFKVVKKEVVSSYQDQADLLEEKLQQLNRELQEYHQGCPVSSGQEIAGNQKKTDQETSGELSIQKRKITLGTTGDLKKGLKGYTYSMNAGSVLVFNKINEKNGIRDKLIELVALDDSYDPALARDNIMRFLHESHIDIIFNPIGSPTIVHYLDLIKNKEVLVLFPHTGALAVRSPDLPYVINFQESYFQEGKILADYIVQHTSSRRFAILYQNDSYGIPPKDSVIDILKKHAISTEDILLIPYDRNNVNISTHADTVQTFGPDALFFFSTATWAKSFITYIGAGYFSGKYMMTTSLLATKEFRMFMQSKGLPLIFAAQTPNPELSMLPIVQEFRGIAKKHDIDVDTSSLEGYIAAELFIYLLNRIPKDMPITKQAIVRAAQSIHNEEYKGLKLQFNAKTNGINNTIWLATQEGADWQTIEVKSEDI